MKITMYELLGMIKDSKAPKKIKYKEVLYYDEELKNYFNDEDMHPLFDDVNIMLDEEVEILEEEKEIPEKLEIIEDGGDTGINDEYMPYKQFRVVSKKINEIIDYLDYLKSKGE